jgi:hypothetical protein
MRKMMGIAALAAACWIGFAARADVGIGDERALPFHLDQKAIEAGKVSTDELIEMGRYLFNARFTVQDGAGRPGSTGSGLPTRRPRVRCGSSRKSWRRARTFAASPAH